VAEGTSLENWHTRKGIEGSNPSLSVNMLRAVPIGAALFASTLVSPDQ
jgi:hypothetical protein